MYEKRDAERLPWSVRVSAPWGRLYPIYDDGKAYCYQENASNVEAVYYAAKDGRVLVLLIPISRLSGFPYTREYVWPGEPCPCLFHVFSDWRGAREYLSAAANVATAYRTANPAIPQASHSSLEVTKLRTERTKAAVTQ